MGGGWGVKIREGGEGGGLLLSSHRPADAGDSSQFGQLESYICYHYILPVETAAYLPALKLITSRSSNLSVLDTL